MAERIPQSRTEKVDTKEKQTGDASAAILNPDNQTEGFEETNYGSSPGSSEVMSVSKSSIWTSGDHLPEESSIQQESSAAEHSSENTAGGQDSAVKPADVVRKPMTKKAKFSLFKKAYPVSKRVASTPELTESLLSSEEEDTTRTSPHKTRSRFKLASGLPKLVSIRKKSTANKSRSCSPAKLGKGAKPQSSKSPVKKLSSGIPTSVTSKKQRLMVPLPDKEPGLSTEKEMNLESSISRKRTSPSKAISVQSKQNEVTSEADECSMKPKRASKFKLGKFKTTKRVATEQTPTIDVESEVSPTASSAFALVRKGIKKMEVSGKLKKSTKKAEETRLIDKEKKASKAKSAGGEDEFSEDRSLNEPYVFKKTAWKPINPAQEGGLLAEDMIAYLSSSEKDTTPTEMSTLSDSSSLVRVKSKSQHSRRRTLDSTSRVSSFEEEVEGGTAGTEGESKSQLPRQTNVPDLEMEDDPGEVFDSPERKVPPVEESGDESKG